jgi:phage/plasmid primase-like uncharacterized protein
VARQTVPYADQHGKLRKTSVAGRLIVPMRDIDGRLMNIQTIDSDGTKRFLQGGRVEGMHAIVGGELGPNDPIIISEGYATASTVSRAAGLPVIAAFNAGNIAPVAGLYRERYPERSVIIAGDNDHAKSADQNVGRRKSEEAAAAVGGVTLLPDFAPHERGTDWNDHARTHGMGATAQAIVSRLRALGVQPPAAVAVQSGDRPLQAVVRDGLSPARTPQRVQRQVDPAESYWLNVARQGQRTGSAARGAAVEADVMVRAGRGARRS